MKYAVIHCKPNMNLESLQRSSPLSKYEVHAATGAIQDQLSISGHSSVLYCGLPFHT